MRRASHVAAAVALAVGAGVVPGAASAHDEPLIQPGAPVRLSAAFGGQYGVCTLNFVFRDAQHTYIGSTARCGQTLGERAVMANREFGTVVYRVLSLDTLVESITHTESIDDFALIRVDPSEVHRVSPVVLDVGRSPHGITTSDSTATGDMVFMTGQGVPYGQWPTRHRIGALVSDDARGFHLAIPASLGDGGAPVLSGDFKAYGVLASSLNVQGPYGTTIERILHLLEQAGFDVHLVTAYDGPAADDAGAEKPSKGRMKSKKGHT